MKKFVHLKEEEIERIISSVLKKNFNHVVISKVKVREDVDFDGDDILRVSVVFEGSSKDLNASELSGAVRYVRPKLIEKGQEAFPLFSFISEKDASLNYELR